ncbi:MAG: hypothetical protein FWB88_12225 [Defluviitaleaceae bacterium]|nr:hypothetical protein [Defluviitaleaceae bacterium]MCL2240328.1 hypothetical protein [Defluviitaleaceae bacterium]
MKIGEYVTVQEVINQSECRWVVISDLQYCDYGGYEDIEGGIIRCIARTKREAGKKAADLELGGIPTLLINGTWETGRVHVGGLFVE